MGFTMKLCEINKALSDVNNAIEKLVQGKSLTEFRVGSGDFFRYYKYGEVTLEALKEYRDELLMMKHSLEDTSPTFRNNACFRITGTK
jgi:hypothetical protein